jgi:hypothetical protein
MRVLWLVFTFPNGYVVVCFFRNNISFGVHKERPEIITKCFLPDPRLSKKYRLCSNGIVLSAIG